VHGSTLRLLFSQTVEVVEAKCHTVTYAYRLATGETKDAWLARWEYFRRPPRPDYFYPLAKPAPHLHLPTGRVPFELDLWHLIENGRAHV